MTIRPMKRNEPTVFMKLQYKAIFAIFSLVSLYWANADETPGRVDVIIRVDGPAKKISPDLVGIFFEDINYAADGGLYAELVQNRSFEYSEADNKKWNALTAWEPVMRGGAAGTLAVETTAPVDPNNPHYAVLKIENGGSGAGLMNSGYDGIALKAGDKYDVSLFARQIAGQSAPLIARLESKDGTLLGETTLSKPGGKWAKITGVIEAGRDEPDARLVILATGPGTIGLDMISLFPQKTFHNRSNGLRADLAQVIADLKPKFVRFPGGCLVHGDGLANIYHWKNTIGPVEQRKEQRNIWGYHQSTGLGYFEYFQFCEDIGAKPLPVVAAGVCCQNSGRTRGTGQQGIPMDQMKEYVQEVLDLVEYANGAVTTKWGAMRAAAGHPAPFNLEYLGVGNEDAMTPVFKERFKMIHDAVKARYPKLVIVGTVGPAPNGHDYDEGWKIASELRVDTVDEHYYKGPDWFLANLGRYDSYDRSKSKVYVGEYAAHDTKRKNTLRSALAEAAYITGLERNGDVVRMASYAPLLAKRGHTQWNPNLIYFTNTTVSPTINYCVQQLFGTNCGDTCMETTVGDAASPATLAASTVHDSSTGDLILKFVNCSNAARPLHIVLAGAKNIPSTATKTVLAGPDANVVNEEGQPPAVQSQASPITIGPVFDYEAPANSLTVIRINPGKT